MWVTGQYPVEVVCLGTKEHFEPGLSLTSKWPSSA